MLRTNLTSLTTKSAKLSFKGELPKAAWIEILLIRSESHEIFKCSVCIQQEIITMHSLG